MGSQLDRLRSKRGRKVTVLGEEYIMRGMTLGELRRMDALPKEEKTAFMVGCTLCDESGLASDMPKSDGESDSDWAKRIALGSDDVETPKLNALSQAVARLSEATTVDAAVKN